jgi:hypothetical protein
MNPRLALYLSAALLLTAISPGQATGGTIASQAADSTLSNVDPATGREALYNLYVPVLDHHGRAVTADLATS